MSNPTERAQISSPSGRATTVPPQRLRADPLLLAVAGLVSLGILLRVRHWWAARGLWGDEVSIALNIASRSFSELFDGLDYDQAAPIGWLLLERGVYLLWSDEPELSLRLPQLILGIFGLLAIAAIGLRDRRPWIALLPTGAVALLPTYIYYSAEVKQYIGDFCMAAVLLGFGLESLRAPRMSAARLAAFALVGAIAVAISHASAFVIAGIGLGLAGHRLCLDDRRGAAAIVGICAGLAGLYLFLHLAATRNEETLAAMRGYWLRLFAPAPWGSAKGAFWYYTAWIAPARTALAEGRFFPPGWPTGEVLAAVAMTVGAWRVVRCDLARAAMLVLPLLFALIASAFALYPFGWRFLLFAAPSVLLLVAEGLEGWGLGTARGAPATAAVLVGLFALPLGVTLLETAPGRTPFAAPDIRRAATIVAQGYRPGDVVYVGSHAQHVFRFYRARVGLEEAEVIYGKSVRDGIGGVFADAAALRGADRVWAIFANHLHNQDMAYARDAFHDAMDERAHRLLYEELPGAIVMLYARGPAAGAEVASSPTRIRPGSDPGTGAP